jgi:aspartate 1-decarboxylase
MMIQICKSKIHRATVTEADLNYVGSITVDEDLLDAANILPYEKVQVFIFNDAATTEIYTIVGERGSGTVCLNGAAARLAQPGDVVIIISYALVDAESARGHEPVVVMPGEGNRL